VRAIIHSLLWLGRNVVFFVSLALGTLGLLLLAEPARWWEAVRFHLAHLVSGQVLPPIVTPPDLPASQVFRQVRIQELYWGEVAQSWLPSLLVTLKLLGAALVAALVVGVLAGWLMSRLAPRWVRKPAWSLTATVASLPDLLIAVALDIGLVLSARAAGLQWSAPDLVLYQKFLAPVLALTLLAAPYVARVTLSAIEDVSGQLYVRTAVSKGLHEMHVQILHIGKPVLLRVWTAVPVVASILISGTAIVEYMMEIHGIGRALVLHLGPAGTGMKDPYAGVLLLVPLLVLFTAVSALSEAGLRKLDPRLGAANAAGVERPWAGPGLRGERDRPARQSGTLARFVRTLSGAARQAIRGIPAAARTATYSLAAAVRALRDPVLLAGVLLVGALVAVALLAPRLAPHDPGRVFLAFQDPFGKTWAPPFPPIANHPLGTDEMGRDIFTRLIYGTRNALLFAALAVPARFVLAVLLGLPTAWRGGFFSRLIDWLTVVFTAIPQVVLPMVLLRMVNQLYVGQPSAALGWGVICIALQGVPRLARSVRQQAQTVLAQPFLEGAIAAGAGPGRVLWRHVLPHMLPQLLSMLVAEIPLVLTLTATLAYYRVFPGGLASADGTGSMPALPDWGSMMQLPLILIMAGQWWMLAPFAALFVAVLAFTLLGEGLRRRWRQQAEWGWGSQAA
jgi:peptide/nickel transport system permease protein